MSEPNCCNAMSRLGFLCTEDVNHKGDHRADDPDIGVTWDRWKQK